MLRTNSKQARQALRAYIVRNTSGENYGISADVLQTFEQCARFIWQTFCDEYKHDFDYKRGRIYDAFCSWCAGLPSALDTCYFYNRSAVDDLGDILEETAAERARFSEADAEKELTRLIYREIYGAACKS